MRPGCARARIWLFVVATFAAPLPVIGAPSQSSPNPTGVLSSVQGRVLDFSRSAIVGARVAIQLPGDGTGPTAVTDAQGAFTLRLPAGRHKITVTAPGFAASSRTIRVFESSTPELEFVLQVAGVLESVTITAPDGSRVITSTATKTPTPIRDIPQSITVVNQELMKDQLMTSISDVVRYVPGVTSHQGENNRDQIIMRGNSTSADFFVNGVRDDVQYFRDVYNVDRIEALKGPNAMIFGRGGAGGVVNRVLKEAVFQPLRDVSLQAGMYGNRRLAADLAQPLSNTVAVRLNGMFEDADSFRKQVGLQRYGVTPTVTLLPTSQTRVIVSYEYLHDRRTADRGITSFAGAPAAVDRSLFYGNPDDSDVRLAVNLGSAMIEHRWGAATIRNRTLFAGYDRFYQNYVPGAASPDQTLVALSAYNNATERTNIFNQTDVIVPVATGRVRHSLLVGAELGRQKTDNFRNTGFFNNLTTSVQVPFLNPTISLPVIFRQSATDADNHVDTRTASVYAQDQAELSRHLQLVGGVRFDQFDLSFYNRRNGDTLGRLDNLVSPRAGVVFKPVMPLSIYGSYSVSYLPSAGDQFSSLTTITQQLKPEQFTNYEVGAKWDLLSGLSLATALYRLDRTNTRSTDPNDPSRIIQTGSQRTNGYEIGVIGRVTRAWRMAGGYAYQDAFVTSATAAAKAGAEVAQVPRHTFSLWNNCQLHPRVGAALGVIYRADMFAAIDNSVVLPGYTRIDAATFVPLTRRARLQLNVENLFDNKYFANADNNTNISPGYPRTIRVALTTAF
ncbi:MAG TPA: TonB-dependent siderophore receptor [Vicinamibacterales bacterium]|nr:TonB-dependent siderophore receptor [Vicinamibacterales bacterium]